MWRSLLPTLDFDYTDFFGGINEPTLDFDYVSFLDGNDNSELENDHDGPVWFNCSVGGKRHHNFLHYVYDYLPERCQVSPLRLSFCLDFVELLVNTIDFEATIEEFGKTLDLASKVLQSLRDAAMAEQTKLLKNKG